MPGPAEAYRLVLLQGKEELGEERRRGVSTAEAMQDDAEPLLSTRFKVTGLGVRS